MASHWEYSDQAEHIKNFYTRIVLLNYIEFINFGLRGRDKGAEMPKAAWNTASALNHMWEHFRNEDRTKYENSRPSEFNIVREISNTYKHFEATSSREVKSITNSRTMSVHVTDYITLSDGDYGEAAAYDNQESKIEKSNSMYVNMIDGRKLNLQSIFEVVMEFYLDILRAEYGLTGTLKNLIEEREKFLNSLN